GIPDRCGGLAARRAPDAGLRLRGRGVGRGRDGPRAAGRLKHLPRPVPDRRRARSPDGPAWTISSEQWTSGGTRCSRGLLDAHDLTGGDEFVLTAPPAAEC